jgi:NAD(P)-dependent dehydrogenase (short-subunit alcohol dehydrogenase family)
MHFRWVLVTGAAKRIGRSIALNLAAAGWDVVVHYHQSQADAEKTAEDVRALGRQACLAEIDLGNLKLVENLIPALTAEIGPINMLVNNASLFVQDQHDVSGERHMAVNADAPRLLSEAFYKQGSAGVIVNMLDADGEQKDFSAYRRSKQELQVHTLAMAQRFAPRVRVNGVALGVVMPGERQSQAHFDKLVAATPMKRHITPDEVAGAVRFLADNAAVTGQILYADGGMHLTTDADR